MRPLIILVLFLLLVIPDLLNAQNEPEVKITRALNSMLDEHPYRFLIFWMRPQINVNSGYDSNGLYSSFNEFGDYFFSVAPGGSFALRFGERAFLTLDEDVNFVYYKELSQLRDIYNTTSARFVTGSRKTLLTLRGSYLSRKTGIDSEFDIPAIQRIASGGSEFEMSLTPKIDLKLHLNSSQHLYDQDKDIPSTFLPPPDYRALNYGPGLEYWIRPEWAVSMTASFGRVRFIDQGTNDNSYRFFGGLRLAAAQIYGHAFFGYGQTEVKRTARQTTLNSFLADSSVDFRLRDRVTLGGFLRRDFDVSRFGSGNFRITTEGGMRGSFPLGSKFFVDGSYTIGTNNYGNTMIDGVSIRRDFYRLINPGLNYRLMRNLFIRAGSLYYYRNSTLLNLDKSRFTYEIGIRYVISPE